MFTDTCTACAKTQLIFPSQITELVNTDRGPVLHYTCWCGEPQTWVAHEPLAHRDAVAA